MVDIKHLAILKQGVAVWNHWRKHNPHIQPDLKGADLRSAMLRLSSLKGLNLSQADLSDADLKGADLWYGNLIGANLKGADLRGANLWGVNFSHTQVLGANFQGAILTGICIFDWKIDSQTNFKNVLCRFIYRQANQQERLPDDQNASLAPGDFDRWIQTL